MPALRWRHMNNHLRVLVAQSDQKTDRWWIDLVKAHEDELSYSIVTIDEAYAKAIDQGSWDLILAEHQGSDIINDTALKLLVERNLDLPLILITDDHLRQVSSIALPQQVVDLAPQDNPDELAYMITRGIRVAQRRKEQRHTEKVQKALIELSTTALTAQTLQDLYNTIHATINGLMTADNFYICLYDARTELLRFPYYVDQFDEQPEPHKLDNGLTAYVLRKGIPLLASPRVFDELVQQGEVELVGAPSIDWLGVPLILDKDVIGAIAVQTYTEGVRFTPKDLEILQFVSNQVAMTIDRKRAEEALKSESQFRKAIEDSILAGIIAVDVDGRQSYVNPAFCRMVGWSETDLLGATPPFVYWPTEDIPVISEAFRVTTGEDGLASDFELVFQRRNGDRFDAYLLVAPLKDRKGWLASVYDITERKRDEAAIRRQKSRAEALARTAARLNARLNLQQVLETVCEETAKALNVPAVTVFLYNPKAERYEVSAGHGWPDKYSQSFKPIPRKLVESIPRGKDQTVVIPDLQVMSNLPNYSIYQELNIRTSVVASMSRDKAVVGNLSVFTVEHVREFTYDEKELLAGLADLAAQAIVNARLFEDLEQSLRQVRALNAVDVAINASLDVRVTLNILLDQVINLLRVDATDVWLFNPVTQELEFTVGRGFRVLQPTVTRSRLGDSYASQVVVERRLMHIDNLASTPLGYSPVNRLPNEGLSAYIGVPLIAKGQVKGVLEIFRKDRFDLDTDWLELLEALSGQAAIAIDNATLFDQLNRSNEELTHALDATLESWVHGLEARFQEEEGRSERQIDLTLRMARESGIREEEMVHIRRGVLLHDIGMLRVPDSILLKSGPLTDEERAIVQQHPVYAYQLLSPIGFLRPCLDIPYCHHERWDGSGYPRHLPGAQIPLAARIFSIIDVWNILLSDTVYRPAWEEARVLDYIKEQAGILFDPELVPVFFSQL